MKKMWVLFLLVISFSATSAKIFLPPFRQISHDIQSGPIEIVDNQTLIINNFYFDGLAPKALFRVGKGETPSENSTVIPYLNNLVTLPILSNANITLKLPGLTVNDVDYLTVWCEAVQMSLGHVFMNERWIYRADKSGMILPKTIGSFKNTTHGVSSESIVLLDEMRIFLPNFNYNGENKSETVQLWLRKEPSSIDSDIPLLIENDTSVLSTYNNANITVYLPDNYSLVDFDYLAVYNPNKKINYGFASFKSTSEDMKKYIGKQFPGFNNPQYDLKTGPIILTNQNTLYITNFKYRGFGKEYFCAEIEGRESKCVLISNQRGKMEPIIKDEGTSFYLNLPELPNNLKNAEVNYFFGIWDKETQALITKINFTRKNINGKDDIPAKITIDGKRIIRYPKCCKHGEMITSEGCVQTDLILDNTIPSYYSNATHLNTDSMINDRIVYVPFYNNLTCPKFKLQPNDKEDQFLYLSSGSLLYPTLRKQYDQDNFCLDVITDDDGIVENTAFICYRENGLSHVWRIAVCICILLSSICLFITAATFFLITTKDDMRGISVAGFSGFMGIAFFCLFLTQLELGSITLCNVLGFIFQFFIVSSLIWLDALCYEMFYNIKNYDNDNILGTYKKRALIYCAIALIFPLIFVIISIATGIPAGLLNDNLDKNCFLDASSKKWLLYSPILATIIIAIIGTAYNIHFYHKTNKRNAGFWNLTRDDIKTRLIQSIFLVVITSGCWFFEVITYAMETPLDALDIIHALQGFFTMCIVLSTGKVFQKLKARLGCGKKSSRSSVHNRKSTNKSDNEFGTELQPINNNGNVN